MPGLRELQTRFIAALFDNEDERVHAHIRQDGIDAASRLDIYRNNLQQGFIKALAIGFPVIERLVGADYFRQLALEFLRAHPSASGNLHHIGEPFAPFLRAKFGGTQYAYFRDVAALEWAHQEALVAADAIPMSVEAFRDIEPTDYEKLTFDFHPACRFVQARCPVVRIWRANQPQTQSDELIDLTSASDNVLVLRTPECVEFHLLSAARFALFEALSRGDALGLALERAQAIDAEFDVGAALRHLVELNILAGVRKPAA
jgi:hypothetical protein